MNLSAKTGRNNPCPCGSGRKYKRCCLEADEARVATNPAPARTTPALPGGLDGLAADPKLRPAVLAALGKLSAAPEAAAERLFERLGGLIAEGGPLARLRFDGTAFDTCVSSRLDTVSGEEDPLAALAARCLPELATPAVVDELQRSLRSFAARARRPEDREAAALGLVTLAMSRSAGTASVAVDPALDAIFRAQLGEWGRRKEELAGLLKAVTGEDDLRSLTPAELARRFETKADAVAAALEAAPGLVDTFWDEADRAHERILRRYAEADPPALLAADERLELTAALSEDFEPPADGRPLSDEEKREVAGRFRAALDHALDAGLGDTVAARLQTQLVEATDPESRRTTLDLLQAFAGRRASVTWLGYLKAPPLFREPGEEPVARRALDAPDDPAALADYERYLRGAGHAAAADRVARLLGNGESR